MTRDFSRYLLVDIHLKFSVNNIMTLVHFTALLERNVFNMTRDFSMYLQMDIHLKIDVNNNITSALYCYT